MLENYIKRFEIRCIAKGLASSSIQNYRTTVGRFDKFLAKNEIETIQDVDMDVVSLYLCERAKTVKTVTVKTDFVTLKTFFTYLKNTKVIEEHPMEYLDKPKIPHREMRSFSNQEVKLLLNHFDKKDFMGLRNHTIMLILYGTGIRLTEMCNIKIEDINFPNDTINIIGKGNKQRYVPLNDVLKAALTKYGKRRKAYMEDRGISFSPYLLISKTGKKLNKANVEDIFLNTKKELGITEDRFCAHTWRHTFAINYLRNGGDVFTLQKILGHSNLETTKIYINLSNNDIRMQNAKYNPLTNCKWEFWDA